MNLPDIKGRFEILAVHAKRIKLDPTVDLMAVARSTQELQELIWKIFLTKQHYWLLEKIVQR